MQVAIPDSFDSTRQNTVPSTLYLSPSFLYLMHRLEKGNICEEFVESEVIINRITGTGGSV